MNNRMKVSSNNTKLKARIGCQKWFIQLLGFVANPSDRFDKAIGNANKHPIKIDVIDLENELLLK